MRRRNNEFRIDFRRAQHLAQGPGMRQCHRQGLYPESHPPALRLLTTLFPVSATHNITDSFFYFNQIPETGTIVLYCFLLHRYDATGH